MALANSEILEVVISQVITLSGFQSAQVSASLEKPDLKHTRTKKRGPLSDPTRDKRSINIGKSGRSKLTLKVLLASSLATH